MSELITDPTEIARIYEEARQSDGPYNKPGINIHHREPYHLVAQGGNRYLDLHSQILCDSLGSVDVQQKVNDAVKGVGMTTFGPDFTHPILD